MAPEFPEEFHRTFVQLVLSVFLPATRSLTEMRHLLKVHWDAYVSPVVRGEVSATSQEHQHIRRLWRNIEPHLRRALNTLYVKEVNSAQYSEMQKLMEQSDNKLPTVNTISGGTAQVELPYYSKFLLLASYLASYNPARSDRRYFLKHHGKQKKTQAMIKDAVLFLSSRTVDFDIVRYLYDFA
ncbi:origin recognition complex subunit 5 [Hyalella azteca]|uniref:Origin recognition complex subunit 5 n=1 Tax=Hyalella azteca TaxID=294128 RepID=A0A8B7P5M7_HYAAZ|nr:origin recognition complex subunit 5 [Hyalella azteca]